MPYAPAEWWPGAVHRPIPYWQDAPPFTAPPEGWMLHVSEMTGSLYDLFAGLTAPNRRFSHLWIARSGAAEQYGPFSRVAWAAEAANPRFVMAETEGQPSEPLTDAQMDTLAALHVWLGAPDHIAATPSEGGISCHYLGGADWGGHTCPDPAPGAGPRSHQRAAIVARAQQIRTGGDDMQLSELAGWDVSKLVGLPPDALNFQTLIARVYSATVLHPTDPAALAAALAKFLPAGSGVDA